MFWQNSMHRLKQYIGGTRPCVFYWTLMPVHFKKWQTIEGGKQKSREYKMN